MTNMDALTIPAVGGVDTTVIIVGDFSNGNDGIVLKNGASVKDLKGRSVKLVEFTVSQSEYNAVALGHSCIEATVAPGWLGVEWIVSRHLVLQPRKK